MATAALTMLCQSLLEASFIFTKTSGSTTKNNHCSSKISMQAFAFIQGTGLDIAIQAYGLEYNPKELRDSFNKIFKANS